MPYYQLCQRTARVASSKQGMVSVLHALWRCPRTLAKGISSTRSLEVLFIIPTKCKRQHHHPRPLTRCRSQAGRGVSASTDPTPEEKRKCPCWLSCQKITQTTVGVKQSRSGTMQENLEDEKFSFFLRGNVCKDCIYGLQQEGFGIETFLSVWPPTAP